MFDFSISNVIIKTAEIIKENNENFKHVEMLNGYAQFQMGYAKMEQKGNGLHLRTFSRAFIIDDGGERFVFVCVDSAMIGNDIRQEVT